MRRMDLSAPTYRPPWRLLNCAGSLSMSEERRPSIHLTDLHLEVFESNLAPDFSLAAIFRQTSGLSTSGLLHQGKHVAMPKSVGRIAPGQRPQAIDFLRRTNNRTGLPVIDRTDKTAPPRASPSTLVAQSR